MYNTFINLHLYKTITKKVYNHTKYYQQESFDNVDCSFVSWGRDGSCSHLSSGVMGGSLGVSADWGGSMVMQVCSAASGSELGVTTSCGEGGGERRVTGGALHARCCVSTLKRFSSKLSSVFSSSFDLDIH